MSFFSDLVQGFIIPIRAAGLILRSRALFVLSIIPLLISALIYFLLYQFVLKGIKEVFIAEVSKVIGYIPGISDYISQLQSISGIGLNLAVEILFWVISLFMFAITANLVALPFNDYLAEIAEPLVEPKIEPCRVQGFGQRLKLIFIDLFKNLFSIVVLIFCLLVSLIPFVNILAFIISSLLFTFQYLSYPQTRRAMGLGRSIAQMLKFFALSFGFGTALMASYGVPPLIIFMPAISSVGGTILFAEISQRANRSVN